jgi:hypothetical protein
MISDIDINYVKSNKPHQIIPTYQTSPTMCLNQFVQKILDLTIFEIGAPACPHTTLS